MSKKLRQVTDNIHDTIYMSELESDLIATPYFYRLHDVYQNSTVYMAFPSNRTKRYEHSLGTMELASSMLFSAISNADTPTRKAFFDCLHTHFIGVVESLMNPGANPPTYFTKCHDEIGEIFGSNDQSGSVDSEIGRISNSIQFAMQNNYLADEALANYQYYYIDDTDKNEILENDFLYKCLLQAVRIVALFHDVGHPPFSHILENAIENLYYKVKLDSEKLYTKSRKRSFLEALSPFFTYDEKENNKMLPGTLYNSYEYINNDSYAPHERIGLSFLLSALNDIVPEKIERIHKNKDKAKDIKLAEMIYIITVIEFSIAILTEKKDKNPLFPSVHRLIDGLVDSDRLDYIVRDSKNSGIDWGTIPYKRIIQKAKFVCPENKVKKPSQKNKTTSYAFIIAFPEKIADDISDLLVTRYKLFNRINFHHRCIKPAVALQNAVCLLAEDYLKSDDDSMAISPEISLLWNSLRFTVGNRERNIIRWNDSWLITTLHNALIKMENNIESGLSDDEKKLLQESLKEVLLNEKKYYAIIKRGSDSQELVEKILKKAGLSFDKIEKLTCEEKEVLAKTIDQKLSANDSKILSSSKANAVDSLRRMPSNLQEAHDLEYISQIFPPENNDIINIICDVLRKEQGKTIENYKVIKNAGKTKYGLPKHKDSLFDEIYLYDRDGKIHPMDISATHEQIIAISKSIPDIFVYVSLREGLEMNSRLRKKLLDKIAQRIGSEIKNRLKELFGNSLNTAK